MVSNLKHHFDVVPILLEEVRSALGVPVVLLFVQSLGELHVLRNLVSRLIGNFFGQVER